MDATTAAATLLAQFATATATEVHGYVETDAAKKPCKVCGKALRTKLHDAASRLYMEALKADHA